MKKIFKLLSVLPFLLLSGMAIAQTQTIGTKNNTVEALGRLTSDSGTSSYKTLTLTRKDTVGGSGYGSTLPLIVTSAGLTTGLNGVTLDKVIINNPNTTHVPDFINGLTAGTPNADAAPRVKLTVNGTISVYDSITNSVLVGAFGGEYGAGNHGNTVLGYNIQIHSEQYATLIGYNAGHNISGQSYNTCVGWIAGENLSGARNCVLGVGACDACKTDNIAMGYDAGAYNNGISNSIFLGNKAGYNLGNGVPNTDGMFVVDCSAGNGFNSFLVGNGTADGGGNIQASSYLRRNYAKDSLWGTTVWYDQTATQGKGLIPIYAYAKLTGQTAATNITTYTTAVDGVYEVGGYMKVTAIATDVIKYQVSYTDETNASVTQDFYPQGTTTSSIPSTGNYPYNTMQIYVKGGTVITLKTLLTVNTGSITYDASGAIMQIGK